MEVKQIQGLEQSLDYVFKRIELIIEALTHRSHHHEYGDSPHNERLEFLGDAVLDLCCTEFLMESAPGHSEGQLSKLRSFFVAERSLARAARKLELGKLIRLGKGEEQSGGRERSSLLADMLEAIIGAVYLDGGIEAAKKIVFMSLELNPKNIEELDAALLRSSDFKSTLQEMCQKAGFGTPSYICKKSEGPDHLREFTMALRIQGIEVVEATCVTKKNATQKAAKKLLLEIDFNSNQLNELLGRPNLFKEGGQDA
ncbi:ribonuclease III [bacterium]|nr:ribonuclease III [bacterium]